MLAQKIAVLVDKVLSFDRQQLSSLRSKENIYFVGSENYSSSWARSSANR